MSSDHVVIVGAGTGGLAAARRLRRKLKADDRITLIERDLNFKFAPSFLWVLAGTRQPGKITSDLGGLRSRGIEVVEAEVTGFEFATHTVQTEIGHMEYDHLIIALGADLAPDSLPGFRQAAHNVYTLEGAISAARELRQFQGGNLVVAVSSQPYKCPAAPYEAALLADAVLRRTGARERTSIDIFTPDPFPMATAGPVLGDVLTAMLHERDIGTHFQQAPISIDTESRQLVFTDHESAGFDLLLGVPPHVAPAVLADTGLVGPSGYMTVDPFTLETEVEAVYAIGDATTVPIAGGKTLPKAGVFAHAQGDVVADRIAAVLANKEPSATFDGKGGCFLEVGNGRAAFATGNFYGDDGPEIRLRRPGRHWHLAKVALETHWMRRTVR